MKKMKEYKYHIGLNLRIYPSDKQKKIIKMNGGASRYIYNKLVADNNEMYELKKTASFSFADKVLNANLFTNNLFKLIKIN